MSIDQSVEQLHQDHVTRETAIMQHGVESRTRWQLLFHRMFRKLSKEYRARRRIFVEEWDAIYELEEGLPEVLRTVLTNAECNVPDVRWFQVMEKPRLLELMLAATKLCEVFRLSNYTANDRHTLFWSPDHGTIARSFGYMLDDIPCGGGVALPAEAFPFHTFALAELREVAAFIDMILVGEN